jgi:integral membrane protein (TIGR01906 family)
VRLLARVLVALGLTAVLLGISVQILLAPAYTRMLSARVSQAEEAGLSPARMLLLAEEVRAFVAAPSPDATLPETVEGRPGFDAAATSHLRDVAGVLSGAKIVTALLGGAILVWLAVMLRQRRHAEVAAGLRAGAGLSAAVVVLAAVFALTAFDAFFSAFHGLFFKPGTWTISYDSLLIRLFPEPFWVASGAAWAGLVLLGAGGLWLAAGLLERSAARTAPAQISDERA